MKGDYSKQSQRLIPYFDILGHICISELPTTVVTTTELITTEGVTTEVVTTAATTVTPEATTTERKTVATTTGRIYAEFGCNG